MSGPASTIRCRAVRGAADGRRASQLRNVFLCSNRRARRHCYVAAFDDRSAFGPRESWEFCPQAFKCRILGHRRRSRVGRCRLRIGLRLGREWNAHRDVRRICAGGCDGFAGASEARHWLHRQRSFDAPQLANSKSQADEEKPADGRDRAGGEDLGIEGAIADRQA